jgi:hypothetical protein
LFSVDAAAATDAVAFYLKRSDKTLLVDDDDDIDIDQNLPNTY